VSDVTRVLDRLGSHSSTAERRAVRELIALGRAAAPELRTAARTRRNAHARAAALVALAALEGARASDALIQALRDPASPVRHHALQALDRHAWTLAASRATARALRDESPGVRHNAAVILGRRRVRSAARRLSVALADPVWHVRQQSAIAIGALRARSAIARLHRAATDARPAVRIAATRALAQIGVA
jgi:HEAT repeat protein